MTARARSYDRDTSHFAADSVKGITELKRRILQTFEIYGPMTDEKLVENYGKEWGISFHSSVSGLRSRRCDLERAGYLVERKDLKGTSSAGNKATVFALAGLLW